MSFNKTRTFLSCMRLRNKFSPIEGFSDINRTHGKAIFRSKYTDKQTAVCAVNYTRQNYMSTNLEDRYDREREVNVNFAPEKHLEHLRHPSVINTSGSDRLMSSAALKFSQVDSMESRRLVTCPLLLDPETYDPDLQDLDCDTEARLYWLKCFKNSAVQFWKKQKQRSKDKKFVDLYSQYIHDLEENHRCYGHLTVRSMMAQWSHCLSQSGLTDPYLAQKQQENAEALTQFTRTLFKLDLLPWKDRQFALIRGILAGNIFDSGAHAARDLMEQQDFGLEHASSKLQDRPWLIDDFDAWLDSLRGKPHRCAVMFVDNSGADIVLGVFPFVRELLHRGTRVILSANTGPALNDVTHEELVTLTERISDMSTDIRQAVEEKRLLVIESGARDPCIDLSSVNAELSEAMESLGTDLVILEGMGRAIHTNFNATFTCESLKLGVIKDSWLANRMGGPNFSVVFKYERGTHVPHQKL